MKLLPLLLLLAALPSSPPLLLASTDVQMMRALPYKLIGNCRGEGEWHTLAFSTNGIMREIGQVKSAITPGVELRAGGGNGRRRSSKEAFLKARPQGDLQGQAAWRHHEQLGGPFGLGGGLQILCVAGIFPPAEGMTTSTTFDRSASPAAAGGKDHYCCISNVRSPVCVV